MFKAFAAFQILLLGSSLAFADGSCSTAIQTETHLYKVSLSDPTENKHWLVAYRELLASPEFGFEIVEEGTRKSEGPIEELYRTLVVKAPAGALNSSLDSEVGRMVRSVVRLGEHETELPLFGNLIENNDPKQSLPLLESLPDQDNQRALLFEMANLIGEGIYFLGEGKNRVSLFVSFEWARRPGMFINDFWASRNLTVRMEAMKGTHYEVPFEENFLAKSFFSLSSQEGTSDSFYIHHREDGFGLTESLPYGVAQTAYIDFVYNDDGRLVAVRLNDMTEERSQRVEYPLTGFMPRIK